MEVPRQVFFWHMLRQGWSNRGARCAGQFGWNDSRCRDDRRRNRSRIEAIGASYLIDFWRAYSWKVRAALLFFVLRHGFAILSSVNHSPLLLGTSSFTATGW